MLKARVNTSQARQAPKAFVGDPVAASFDTLPVLSPQPSTDQAVEALRIPGNPPPVVWPDMLTGTVLESDGFRHVKMVETHDETFSPWDQETVGPDVDSEPETEVKTVEILAVEAFEQIVEYINALEPEESVAVHEVMDKTMALSQKLQSTETNPEAMQATEEELVELFVDLCAHLELDYSEEEIRNIVTLWLKHNVLQKVEVPEESAFEHLFDDLGTHEGLRYFSASLKKLKAIFTPAHLLLGKFVLLASHVKESVDSTLVLAA